MPDSAPDYAIQALDRVIQARGNSSTGGGAASLSAEAVTLPSLTFQFKSPSFLGNGARWVLFLLLLAIGTLALIVARDMVDKTSATEGAEWVGPPIMALVVAGFALAFGFACVMGFGQVELSSSIGTADAGPGAGLTVTDTVPPDNATGKSLDVQIEATFSAAIDPASLTTSSFVLRKQGDTVAIPGDVKADTNDTKARLKPTAPLTANTTYEAELTTAVKTPSGSALAAAKKWTFTTRA